MNKYKILIPLAFGTILSFTAMAVTGSSSNLSEEQQTNSPQAESTKVDHQAAQQLRLKLASFRQFSSQFKQTVFDAQGQVIQQSTGEMQVKQPNKFRWQTYAPDESLIVSDGEAVWIYNEFVEQVTAMELDTTIQQSPLWLIANQTDQSWSQFTVTHSQHGYAIVPTDPNSLTKRIIIRFSNDKISQLVIEDNQGQSSEFSLHQFESSLDIDDQIFNFVMPEGVDFDDQREAKE